MKYNPLTRRMFLQGAGGYALSIPFLQSLAPKAHAQAAAPMRFAMVLGQFGRDMGRWYPNLPDSAMSNVGGVLMKPLADIPKPISYSINNAFNPVMNKISLIRGLDSMSTNGLHNSYMPTTGSAINPTGGTGFGYSMDSILEESAKFYPQTPFHGALRVAPFQSEPFHDFGSFSYTSKSSRGQRLPYEWNPRDVYNRLLNPQIVPQVNARNARIRTAYDSVFENFKQVMNGRAIANEDKYKLDSYMNLMSEIHRDLAVPLNACSRSADPGTPNVASDIHKAMMRLEVAALACGVTRITMHIIAHPVDSGVSGEDWHNRAHGGATSLGGNGQSHLSEYSKYSMDLVAYYLAELDKVQESNGTLLDNTFFMYGNEDGTGSHEHADMAVLVAGAKGKLKTGFFIDYRQRPMIRLNTDDNRKIFAGRPYNNMMVTAMRSCGLQPADYQKFGRLGLGSYGQPFGGKEQHYTLFMGSKVNDPLPFLYTGV